MSYEEKFNAIHQFESSLKALIDSDMQDIQLSKSTRIIFVTNFGYVEGKVIYNSSKEIDTTTREGKNEALHNVLKRTADLISEDTGKKRATAIPLNSVTLRPFNGEPTKLDYFLLYVDQVVGLTFR